MRSIRTLVRLALLTSLPTAPAFAASHPSDAAVRSIQFVDEREGWAVGDDGVIWHSIDGGQKWERQKSGVRASLRSVHFLTPYTGWVVGRMELAGGDSRGIVLVTTDGGLTWSIASTSLPGLNYVHFFTQRNGIAAGDGSDAFPTGVFTTIDSGRTWKPIPGKRCPTWLTADFSDGDTGILGGPWSQLATLRDGYFGAAEVDDVGSRSIRGMKLQGSFAVAVGQGGLILTSSKSAGMKWGFAVPNLGKEVLAACDFEAVAVRGKHLWVAGRPGTFVLHSPDLGQTWELQKTGQALPLHSLYFFNENQGWATGEMGTILVTQDGGKTWNVRRQEAQRSAILFVNSSSRTVPLDVISLLGEEDGYHTTALCLTCAAAPAAPSRNVDDDKAPVRKMEPSGSHPRLALDPEKMSAAMRLVGGSSGESLWQFPLPHHFEDCSTEKLLAHWDLLHGGRSSTQLLRQLVLAIRIWRPEVIITDARQKGAEASPAEKILIEALKEAFNVAADPAVFPEQTTYLKLAPWAAKKLYAQVKQTGPENVKMPLQEVKTRLGDCARDFAQPAEMLLCDKYAPVDQRYFRLLATRLQDSVGDVHVMQGISLAQGGQARRDLPPVEEEEIKARPAIEKAVQKRQTLEAMIRGDAGPMIKPEMVLAQIAPALKEMPADHGARAAFAIANQYVQTGQWAMAKEAFLLLADKYPNHPLALEAYRWLVRYQSSGEARRRQELGQFLSYTETDLQKAAAKQQTGIGGKGGSEVSQSSDDGRREIVQTNHTFVLQNQEETRKWFQDCLAIDAKLAPFGPMYANDPAIQMCVQSSRRQLGDFDTSKKWFSRYLSETAVPLGGQTAIRGADAYRDCAMAELWLLNRTIGSSPAKPLSYCPRCNNKPNLDGKLDDECWEGVQPMVLSTTAGDLEQFVKKDDEGKSVPEYQAKAWFTYDNEYLYIAVHCTHPIGMHVPPVDKRGRDMDLRPYDRVSIMLDIDRDYQTYYHLQIDQRGCLADDCWGDSKWDPNWFVAIQSDESSWTAEAAIPLAELTGELPRAGNVWAANVTRILPGRGVQAWSTPADARPRPEGMGLLQFIEAPKR